MRRIPLLCLALAMVLSGSATVGQAPPVPPATTGDEATDELIAQERIRAGVESILANYLQPVSDGRERVDMAIAAMEALVLLGPEVVPYLENELEQHRNDTLDLCSYALGMLNTAEAEAALRKAIVRAEDNPGGASKVVKVWAAWGLGLQGKPDAVDLVVGGRHQVAIVPMHGKTSLLEALAIQTEPESVPRLAALLERLKESPEDDALLLRATLQALRRARDPEVAPKVLPLLDHPASHTRREAANGLRGMGSPAAIQALVEALGDESKHVRQSVALALEYIGADSHRKAILKHLETEDDPATRGALYRLLAATAGAQAFDILQRYRDAENPMTRAFLLEALELIDDPRRIELLRAAQMDDQNTVALRAILTLGRIPGQAAADALTEAVPSARLNVARAAAERLGAIRATGAAEAISERLLGEVLSEPVTDLRMLLPVEKMTAALIRLDHHAVLPRLREALKHQTHPNLIRVLEDAVRQLELVQRNGKDAARWIETAEDSDPELRMLAYDHLGRIGNAAASQALLAAFERIEDVPERVEIVRDLGRVERPEIAKILTRLLLQPEFDSVHHLPLRDMAAWIARQQGGESMYALLEAAARRRNGRDVRVLVYAAVLGGERAIPLLESLRKPRMRYLGWQRGVEQERLDWIVLRLESGRTLRSVDLPPEKLVFR